MKKTFSIVFAALGMTVCLALFVCFLLLGPSAAGANEVLSPPPSAVEKDGTLNDAYLRDCADYYDTHFHFRQELIDAYAHLHTALFAAAPDGDVILGRNGWLYYGSTLADYTGTAPMTAYELSAAADNLRLMQEYCEAQGMTFAFAPVPNKNTLYDENMPDCGVKNPKHDIERLTELLRERGVNTADLLTAFAGQSETLYFAHDSHWTSRGAALGADCINAALGREKRFFTGDFLPGEAHAGDLFAMLYPTSTDTETDTVYAGELRFSFAQGSGKRPDSISIRTESGAPGALYAFRDSFGNSLYPYLAASYGQTTFSRSVSYNLVTAAEAGADAVVIELVERNLSNLLKYLPVMPAPQREIAPGLSGGQTALSAESTGDTLEGYCLWRGRQTDADADSPVYLLTDHGAYECFRQSDGSFSAYIPESDTATGVAYYMGGALTALLPDYTET